MSDSIIADSSALISLVIKGDTNHPASVRIQSTLMRKSIRIIIPAEIFAETINTLGRKANKSLALDTGKELIRSEVFEIVEASLTIRTKALHTFERQPTSVSFTDCLVMAFADEFNTKDIFGFDDTFRKNGYSRIGTDPVESSN